MSTVATPPYGSQVQTITFQVRPSVSIPQAGKIQIKVPDGFTIGTILGIIS